MCGRDTTTGALYCAIFCAVASSMAIISMLEFGKLIVATLLEQKGQCSKCMFMVLGEALLTTNSVASCLPFEVST